MPCTDVILKIANDLAIDERTLNLVRALASMNGVSLNATIARGKLAAYDERDLRVARDWVLAYVAMQQARAQRYRVELRYDRVNERITLAGVQE